MGIEIYTDGAARGNPGASASGYVIYDPSGRQLAKNTIYNGIKTNNQAEYIAIIAALKEAGRLSGKQEAWTLSARILEYNEEHKAA